MFISPKRSLVLWSSVLLVYLFLEWVYNQHLLLLVQYPLVSASQFEWTEIFGKSLAAIGINLIIVRLYRKHKAAFFAVGVVLAYAVLSITFDRIIQSFSNDTRHSSYYTVLHRANAVRGTDDNLVLQFTHDKPWYVRSLVLSQFYLTLNDRSWEQVEASLQPALLYDPTEFWEGYKAAELLRQYVDTAWDGYQAEMRHFNEFKNHPKYSARAYERFIFVTQSEPNWTKNQFISAKFPVYATFLDRILFKGVPSMGIPSITGRDLPPRMDEPLFHKKMRLVHAQMAPNSENIRSNLQSRDAIALLIIPPISIALSLMSILFNSALLMFSWMSLITQGLWKNASFMVVGISIVVCVAFFLTAPSIVHDSAHWRGLTQAFKVEHPYLGLAIQIPLRLEPLICFDTAPQWIGKGMRVLYASNPL